MAVKRALHTLSLCTFFISMVAASLKPISVCATCDHSDPQEITTNVERTSGDVPGEQLHRTSKVVDNVSNHFKREYPINQQRTASNVVSGPGGQSDNGQNLDSRGPAMYSQHSKYINTRIWTGTPTRGSALEPNYSRQHQLNNSTKHRTLGPRENASRVKHKQQVLIFSETPCTAEFPRFQYIMTVHDPVVLEFKMRKDSEFVPNECFVHLTAPKDTRISVVLLKMSCEVEGHVVISDSFHRRKTWESCVRQINPGVDWMSEGSTAVVRLKIITNSGDGLFTARMNVMAAKKPEPGTIFTRYLTPTLGYMQTVGIDLYFPVSWGRPVKTNTWCRLAVPGHNVVMVSVAIAGLGSLPPAEVCRHRVELYEGSMNRTVWRLYSRYRSLPQPHISHEEHVHVHYVSDSRYTGLMRGPGFRFIYTFHDKSSIPMHLSDGKWNCSIPAWLAFHQHFICDLVVQCTGGEDETDCPAYTQCGHNGVVWRDAPMKNETSKWVQPSYQVVLPNTTSSESCLVPVPHVVCDKGHVTHAFLAFDQQTHCFQRASSDLLIFCNSVRGWNMSDCDGFATSLPVPFTCRSEAQHVHYTLVCDHRQDCQDNSDEEFCFYPPCDPRVHFQCETTRECQPAECKCNYQPDCLDASDEDDCRSTTLESTSQPYPPLIIDLEGQYGYPIIISVKNTTFPYCPHTHYLCPSDGNCLPIFTRCNRVTDCTGKEDERDCESYVCPGLYRCRGRQLCVLPSDLCDGVLHCPQHDDERFCHLPCPDHCTCLGHAFVCRRPFDGRSVRQLRYLDAQGSGLQLEVLAVNVMLIYLSLARCGIIHISNVTLPNLHILDLSDNEITTIGFVDLRRLKHLQDVKLSGNPLVSLFVTPHSGVNSQHNALQALDLSRIILETLSLAVLAPFSSLQQLNLSQSGVKFVQKTDVHSSLPKTLREFDVSGCDFTEFPRSLFQDVDNLKVVYADTYKLCCPAVLPDGFIAGNCHAPADEISSCDDLLRSSFYRFCLSVLAAFGLLGNSVSFLVRFCANKSNKRSGFDVFVQHLCVSDFLMGVYLVFIGVADSLFMSNYLWEDINWRHSAACKLAGFVSFASCEVSSFIICLITVDRFLVLRFPFSAVRFSSTSAQIASVAAWVVGGALAAVPLLPAAQTWQFYSQTGICIPLPVTRQEFAGHGYAFGVMIVLNFVLFILIAGGQVSIYVSIQASKMSDVETSSMSRDAAIARRLITVAVSDFLCWFPVGLLGLLASGGTPVPSTVNVVMAIFVLPLNSTLNPFLYTLNILQERFQKRKEDRMLKILLQQT